MPLRLIDELRRESDPKAGDALARGGKAQRARKAYESAKLSKTFASWPYASVLAERLTNVEARVALYAHADPTNDPQPTSSSGPLQQSGNGAAAEVSLSSVR